MAETKRVYEIRINGIQESFEGVKSLREALDGLSDTVVTVNKEETKSSETRKTTASTTDALAKAQEKLNNYDKQYQEELAKVNASLSANKKEINDAIKLQQAQDTVDAKQLDTYAQKQQYLTALNTLIRNHTTATDEDVQAIDKMVQESAALQAELKAADEQMQIYVRNVGNYNEAAGKVVESHKSVKTELKELKAQMSDMLANGVSKTDEGYLQLAERAGHLKDAIKDANEDITNFASDTRGMTNAINLAQSAVGAYQLYNSTMELFGQGNEDAAESMKKMMAVMTVLNSLQQVQNSLLENGSATARLYHKAVELVQAALGIKKAAVEENIAVTEASTVAEEANTIASELNATASETNAASTGTATTAEATNTTTTTSNTVAKEANTVATNKMSLAQKAGAVASNILSVALRAIPLMAVIGLVMALIQNWESIWNWFKKTFPVLDTLSKKFDKFGGFMKTVKAIAKGLGEGIINWLVNPFKTLSKVMGELLQGHFEAAWEAAKEGLKNQFTGFSDSIKKELQGAANDAIEDTAKKRMEKEHEATEYQLKELEARKGNQAKYSKEGIALQEKEFAQRKALAKGNAEELKKIHLDELNFQRECQEQQTKAAQAGAKARAAAAKSAANEAKKAAEELEKQVENLTKANKKAIEEMQKTINDTSKMISTNMADTYKRVEEESFKARNNAAHHAENLKILIEQSNQRLAEYQKQLKKNREEFAKTGEEFYDVTVKKYAQLIEHEVANINLLNAKLQQVQGEIAKHEVTIMENTWKRQSVMVEQFARDATKTQKDFQDKLQEYRDLMYQNEEMLTKKLSEKRRKDIEKDLANLEREYENVLKAMKQQLGDYANEEIPLKVNIDFDAILQRLSELPDYMQNFFNTNKIAEYILGIDGTTADLFDQIVKGSALIEFKEQFYDAAVAAGATKDKLEEIDKIIRSDLPFDDMKERLHAYRDEMNLTEYDLNSLFDAIVENAATDKAVTTKFTELAKVIGLSKDKLVELQELLVSGLPIDELKKKVSELFSMGNIQLNKFGELAYTTNKNAEAISTNVSESIKKTYQDALTYANKMLTDADKSIKKFQDATKDIKFEPVIEQYKGLFEEFDRGLGITKLNMKETQKRYSDLKKAYKAYLASIQTGSEQMIQYEAAWHQKLENTKALYTEDSMEYRQALDEKAKADAAYVAERTRVSQQIEAIELAEEELPVKGLENLYNNMDKIWRAIQDNVLNPVFDGIGDLFAFQLEQAQEALEETEKLLDKAVEARQQSADRMKEINDELRNDDGQNKEALQQRLAEEEVLLVQREEAERALQKEKEKREKDVQRKEAQQRVLELSQKLVEGIANTALGATAALKYGFPLGPVFAAIITAMGALQTAIISKQIAKAKSQMAHGGVVGEDGISRSHKQGGHKIEDTNIEVEGGEWVVNKRSSNKYDGLLYAINEDNPKLIKKEIEIIREHDVSRFTKRMSPMKQMFASGGQINTLTATSAIRENNEIAALTELVKAIDFQPTVSVVDINRVSKRLVRVQDLSGKSV